MLTVTFWKIFNQRVTRIHCQISMNVSRSGVIRLYYSIVFLFCSLRWTDCSEQNALCFITRSQCVKFKASQVILKNALRFIPMPFPPKHKLAEAPYTYEGVFNSEVPYIRNRCSSKVLYRLCPASRLRRFT